MMKTALPGHGIFRVSKRRLEVLVLVLAASAMLYLFTLSSRVDNIAEASVASETAAAESSDPEDFLYPDTESAEIENSVQGSDYSRFRHVNPFHSRLPCLLCHTRENNSSRMRFPGKSGHLPCAGCHAVQFQDQSNPMCTICHTNPQSGAMKRFPGLKSFRGKFDHSRHRRQDCSVCHTPRSGGARHIPTGANAHDTCFKCHTSSSSHSMSSCSVCHEQGRRTWSSASSPAFRMGFSHAEHAGRQQLNCNSCHTLVRTGSRPGDQMSSPRPAMHFARAGSQSCASCHNSKRAFGTDDFANCKRCHNPNSFRF